MLLNLALGSVLSLSISLITYKLKFISLKGAYATYFLASVIFTFGQGKWTVPILSFFILSSILSKFRRRINPKVDKIFQKTDRRDHIQVLANGGFPGILILINQLYNSELCYIAYVSAIAAVCSDTWATEIGTLFSSKTFDIIHFHHVQQGISGGVSIIGFMGACFGAILIIFSAYPWLIHASEIVGIVFISGFLASTFDSVLGSTLQGKFDCIVCRKTVEDEFHCGNSTAHIKGVKWLKNDAVNFATSLSGGFISLALVYIIL